MGPAGPSGESGGSWLAIGALVIALIAMFVTLGNLAYTWLRQA